MKTRVTLGDFVQAFKDCGRESQFSRPALYGLFNYLEQYEEDTGEEIELDVIALCCDYSEMDYSDVVVDYKIDVSHCDDDEEIREAVREHLEGFTIVVWSDDDSILFAHF